MPNDFITSPLATIAQTTMGALLVIALIAIWYLFGKFRESQNERIKDLKEINTAITGPLQSIKQTVETIQSLLTKK